MLFIIMVEFEEIINTRRSIREYQDKDVEDEKILKLAKQMIDEGKLEVG